jgi:hypothetical protein
LPAISHDVHEEKTVLIFPAFIDRIVVLVTGLVMLLVLGYVVNRMRVRTEKQKSRGENQES